MEATRCLIDCGGQQTLRLKICFFLVFFFFVFLVFLGLHSEHMEVPRLGVELELEPQPHHHHI